MHCIFSVFIPLPFLIVSAASHAPCLVSFFSSASLLFHQPPLQCLLPASSSHGRSIFPFVHPGALLACTDTTVTGEEKWGAEAGGNIFECPPLPAVREGRTARRKWPSPSTETTVRMNLCSWERKSRGTTLLTIFSPASSLSSFSAIGLFWPLKQVSCGLAWISDLH